MAQLPCIGVSWPLTKPLFGGCAIYFHYSHYSVNRTTDSRCNLCNHGFHPSNMHLISSRALCSGSLQAVSVVLGCQPIYEVFVDTVGTLVEAPLQVGGSNPKVIVETNALALQAHDPGQERQSAVRPPITGGFQQFSRLQQ